MPELTEDQKRRLAEITARVDAERDRLAKEGPPKGSLTAEEMDPDKWADPIGMDDKGNWFPVTKQAPAAPAAAPPPAPASAPARELTDEEMQRADERIEQRARQVADEEEKERQAKLPSGTAAGIVAIEDPSGVTLYRDGRHHFSLAVPGRPRFTGSDAGVDATCRLLDQTLVLRVSIAPAPAGTPLADAVRARATTLLGEPPFELAFGQPGVTAAAMGSRLDGHAMREIDVLGGGMVGTGVVVTLQLDYDASVVDPATAATVRSSIVASAAFTAEPRRELPMLTPDSPWLEPGIPLWLRDDRPAVPTKPSYGSLAGELLGVAGPLPPAWKLGDELRGGAERKLAAVVGPEAARAIATRLTTVHDLRGLALSLLRS